MKVYFLYIVISLQALFVIGNCDGKRAMLNAYNKTQERCFRELDDHTIALHYVVYC